MIGIVEEFDNGVVVYQATDEECDKSNIYCEFPWCPPDSHCFVYARHLPDGPNGNEFVACDFHTWEKRVVGRGGAATMANGGKFYYQRVNAKGRSEFVRVDLETGEERIIDLPDGLPPYARLDISPGERYVAYNQTLSYDPQEFGIGLVDLKTGEFGLIHTDPYICNTHHQFEPGKGELLMVQHNRGCRFTKDGTRELLVGPEGATIFALEIPSGKVYRLEVGPPYTYSISGHETWIGTTGEMLISLNVQEDYDFGKGPIVGIRPGQPARTICPGWEVNHIDIEPSGRIFCGDAYEPDVIMIGSPVTNKSAVVCPARTSYQRARNRPRQPSYTDSHPHAYITPDSKWVIFNSDRNGIQQVYAAAIPEEMIAELERE